MNLEQIAMRRTSSCDRCLSGPQLVLARALWGMGVALAVGLFIASIPPYVASLYLLCRSSSCGTAQLTPEDVARLHAQGLSVDFFVVYTLGVVLLFALGYLGVAALIVWHKSNDLMGLLTSFALATFMVAFIGSTQTLSSHWQVFSESVTFLSNVSLGFFFCLFPNGRFVPYWMRWYIPLSTIYWALQAFFPSSPLNPIVHFPILSLAFPALLGIVLIGQVYRYRRISTEVERQQTKWVVFGLVVALVGFVGSIALLSIFPLFFQVGSLPFLLILPAVYFFVLLIPLSLGFAILRYRLWDIDIIINRTLVYGTLTLSVVGSYALVVGGLGALFEVRGSFVLSLLATGLIALLFQPVHLRLQRAVNRLMYGERDEPYRVISRLGSRLEATLAPEAVLPTIVETVAQALKLPYAAITLKQDGEYVIATSYGQAPIALVRLPLSYQTEPVGELLLAPRALGENFTPADRGLLDDLARQAGIAAHAVRLTIDLQRLTSELQQSRAQLITAREEERRRLRRDLHDGLGSVLASLNWRAGAIRTLLPRDPVAADALVVEQQHTIQAAIADIRRLVYDLRPPALDELGLVGAIRERAMQQTTSAERDSAPGLRVDVEAPGHLPALPAAVEVAAYRIVQESLANVTHHAHAHCCSICLECSEESLQIEVTDDGIGLPAAYHAGVGLLSMRERAEELGGTCEVSQARGGGTRVRACLPLSKE